MPRQLGALLSPVYSTTARPCTRFSKTKERHIPFQVARGCPQNVTKQHKLCPADVVRERGLVFESSDSFGADGVCHGVVCEHLCVEGGLDPLDFAQGPRVKGFKPAEVCCGEWGGCGFHTASIGANPVLKIRSFQAMLRFVCRQNWCKFLKCVRALTSLVLQAESARRRTP